MHWLYVQVSNTSRTLYLTGFATGKFLLSR